MILWNLAEAYVIIKVEGLSAERFINTLIGHSVSVKDLKRISYTESSMRLPGNELKLAKSIAENCGMRIVSAKKPANLFRKLMRPSFAVCCALYAASLMFLSNLCLKVDFYGLKTVSEFEVSEYVSSVGAEKYAFKRKISLPSVEYGIVSRFEPVIYANACWKGTTLKISVIEKSSAPVIPEETGLPLIASKDAVVCSTEVERGLLKVSPGDRVNKGDVLIASEYALEDGTEMHVTASGTVKGQVMYRAREEVRHDCTEYVRTGKTASAREASFFIWKIRFGGKDPFKNSETEEKQLFELCPNGFPNVSFSEITFYETEKRVTERSSVISLVSAKERAYKKAFSQVPQDAEILSVKIFTAQENGKAYAEAVIITSENIGTYMGRP